MRVTFAMVVVLLASASGGLAAAHSPRSASSFSVGATVRVRPTVRFSSAAAICVGAQDLERGFVEASRPLEVRSDEPFLLLIASTSATFDLITLEGLGAAPLHIGEGGSWLAVAAVPGGRREVDIRLRLRLSGSGAAGCEPPPLAFSTRPLR